MRENEEELRVYKVVRFTFKRGRRTVKRDLTLAEAQAHCRDPKTKGEGWFDGYELDKPKRRVR